MTKKIINVGMGEMKEALHPDELQTMGLGSCVGIVLYAVSVPLAMMAHVVLPDSRQSRGSVVTRAKFADTAVEAMVESMAKKGLAPRQLAAKIAGGAQMFQSRYPDGALRIGARNVQAVRRCLKDAGIRLEAEETGGRYGRTIRFHPGSRTLVVKIFNGIEKQI